MSAPWGAAQWARFTAELTYGTFNGTASTPDVAATVWWAEFQDENGLKFKNIPQIQESRSATRNLRRRRTGRRHLSTGSMAIKAFPELMIPFVPWACSPTVVSGRLQLPSYTIDWFDGLIVHRMLGVRVKDATWKGDNSTDWVMLNANFQAKKEDFSSTWTLAEPALTVYPTIGAYEHNDSSGFMNLNGVLVGYKSAMIKYENLLDPQFDEFLDLNTCDYCGRNVDYEVVLENLSDTLRQKFEAQTALSGVVKWAITSPSAHNMTFTLNNANFIQNREVDRKFTGKQYQTLSQQTFEDLVAGTDAVASAA